MKSIEYYEKNADSFFNNTIDVNMEKLYQPFLQLLSPDALILDAGCGSGRDSKAFLSKGFRVEAIDASTEMVKRAKQVTGLEVNLKSFDSVVEFEYYDAIWSCASLLHVPESDLFKTISLLARSLKPSGVWYMSFKYGTTQREKDGRLFTDMNENRFDVLVQAVSKFKIHRKWLTKDNRPQRNESWFNAIIIKDKGLPTISPY